MIDLLDDAFFFVLIIIVIIIGFTVVMLLASVPSDEYVERIEEKYNINVVENEDTVVIYNDGKCAAIKLPYDELERIGCGEFSEKLSG